MLAIMPKHKGTDKLRTDLRRRLSQLRDESMKKTGGSGCNESIFSEMETSSNYTFWELAKGGYCTD